MKHINKSKKGMTLIEVIISVALLSILIVPLSSMIITSLKTTKVAQEKQEATYIGQKVLEELKAYDEVSLLSDAEGIYFQLLDGEKIIKSKDGSFRQEGIKRNIMGLPNQNAKNNKKYKEYNVEVIIKKDETFKYDVKDKEDSTAGYKIKLEQINSDKVISINQGQRKNLGNILRWDIFIESNKIKICEQGKEISFLESNGEAENLDEVLIYDIIEGSSRYFNVFNKTEKSVKILNLKESEKSEKVSVFAVEGDVIVSNKLLTIQEKRKGDLYNITVNVSNEKGKKLFDIDGSRNVVIK